MKKRYFAPITELKKVSFKNRVLAASPGVSRGAGRASVEDDVLSRENDYVYSGGNVWDD